MTTIIKISIGIILCQMVHWLSAEKPKVVACGGCKKAIYDIQCRNRYIEALFDSGNVIFISTQKELLLPSIKRKIKIQNKQP